MNKRYEQEYLLRKIRVRKFFESIEKGSIPMIEPSYREDNYRDIR